MRIIFMGSGAFACPTLRWLAQSEHEVPLIVTQPARPARRGRRLTPTPVRELADQLGIAALETQDVNAPEVLDRLRALGARLGLAIAFGQMLGNELLATTPGGYINLHASLLPKYRGAAPINWAVIRGEERTGCTVFKIVKRMDAGPILTSRWTTIKPDETAGELHDRLAGVGVDAVRSALELYHDSALPDGTPQDDNVATKAPKFKKEDGFVRFDRPADEITRHIRGMTPWPGATALFHGADDRQERVTLLRVRRAENPTPPDIEPGSIDPRCYVAANDAFLEILELRPASGRPMTWQEFVNGRHVSDADRFSSPETQRAP